LKPKKIQNFSKMFFKLKNKHSFIKLLGNLEVMSQLLFFYQNNIILWIFLNKIRVNLITFDEVNYLEQLCLIE